MPCCISKKESIAVVTLLVVSALQGICLLAAADSYSDLLGGPDDARYIIGRNSSVRYPLDDEQTEQIDGHIVGLRICGYSLVFPVSCAACAATLGTKHMEEMVLNGTDGVEHSAAELLSEPTKLTARLYGVKILAGIYFAILVAWVIQCLAIAHRRHLVLMGRITRYYNGAMMDIERDRRAGERRALLQQLLN